VFAASDIAVTIANNLGVETALVLGSDYSVTLNSNQETSPGGTVTYPLSGSPLPVGSQLVIVGNLPYDQPLDLPSGGNFSPLALENQLDRLTMQIQQLREQVGRAVQVSVTTGANVGLPAPSANELIGWDSTGNNLQNFALSELATAVAYATMRYDTFTGDGVETQFTLTADPVALANLDVAISGVTQVPGSDYSLLNGVLVFASAPANGTEILARYGEGLVNVGGDSSDIRFLPAGTGAQERTVQAKLRDAVSINDFGAAPSASAAANTTAIQAAMSVIDATGGILYGSPGTYLISGDCGNGSPNTSRIHVFMPNVVFERAPTTSQYNMFSFRQNMIIEGLKLKGYVDSGTGWADVVPANSFGFRSANNAGSCMFINCEADGLPYDGWYIGTGNTQVVLQNCVGKNCYRNDFAATEAKSVVIDGGSFGYDDVPKNKVAGIDIEPDSVGVDYVSIKSLTAYNKIDFWAANGNIRHAIIDGVTFNGSVATLSWFRVRQMDVGEVKFLNGANFYRAGVPDVQSGVQYLPSGAFKRLPNVRALGPNLIANPYNSVAGFTNSNSGTITTVPNYPIGDKRGIQITNTGGGFNVFYQTITVVANEWYTLGGMAVFNTATGGESGLFITMPTLGFAEVYLQANADSFGAPQFLCAAVKIPTGVTSIRVGFGTSGGTRNQAFTELFFCKGIIGEGAVDVPMITYANAAPTTGAWAVGDRVVRATPVVGQPKAWVCTVAGTPGTWVSEGNL
jgi:hypothetical protein